MSHWDDDLLNRKEDAQHIYDVAMKIHNDGVVTGRTGVVMAIDAPWGEGKSYLIDRLCKDIKKRNHPVIHFNAWENDFSNDPIVSFLSEMSAELRNEFPFHKAIVDKVTEASLNVVKKVGVTIIAGLVKKTVGVSVDELASTLTDKPSKGTDSFSADINKDIFNSHIEKKDALEKFKSRMAELVNAIQRQENQKRLPIFVIIDELDRCRPDFSIALLEGVKHLFSLDGVIFLIAANKVELSNSIKVLYGSRFDSTMYLKRFFDIDYTLQTISAATVWQTELRKYKIAESALYLPANASMSNLIWAASKCFGLSVRDIQQLAFKLYLIFDEIKEGKTGRIHILYLLILMCAEFKEEDRDLRNNLESPLIKVGLRCDRLVWGGNSLNEYSLYSAFCAYDSGGFSKFAKGEMARSEEEVLKQEIGPYATNNVLWKYKEAIKKLGRIAA